MVKFIRKARGHFVTLIEVSMCLIECISGHNLLAQQVEKLVRHVLMIFHAAGQFEVMLIRIVTSDKITKFDVI